MSFFNVTSNIKRWLVCGDLTRSLHLIVAPHVVNSLLKCCSVKYRRRGNFDNQVCFFNGIQKKKERSIISTNVVKAKRRATFMIILNRNWSHEVCTHQWLHFPLMKTALCNQGTSVSLVLFYLCIFFLNVKTLTREETSSFLSQFDLLQSLNSGFKEIDSHLLQLYGVFL